MADWDKKLYFEDVEVGSETPSVSMPITLQRLVMEAGANRDFAPIHHNRELAQLTGARDAYMNTLFIMAMIERTLREWIGIYGTIKKIGPFRMVLFNCAGDVVTFKAKVRDKSQSDSANEVKLDIWAETEQGRTVTGEAIVALPSRA